MLTRPDSATVPDEGVSTLVHRAVDDARELARAELALVKAKVGERATAYKNAAIFFGAAATLAMSAVTALLVGLIISLATLVGPGWATAIVVIGTLVIAGVLAVIGKGKLAPAKGGGMTPDPAAEIALAERREAEARQRFTASLQLLQARLKPKALARDARLRLTDAASTGAEAAKRNPLPIIGAGLAAGLFLARHRIARLFRGTKPVPPSRSSKDPMP